MEWVKMVIDGMQNDSSGERVWEKPGGIKSERNTEMESRIDFDKIQMRIKDGSSREKSTEEHEYENLQSFPTMPKCSVSETNVAIFNFFFIINNNSLHL